MTPATHPNLVARTDYRYDRFIVADEIRLSEIITAFSVALDITQGHPRGHSMRSALIGMRLGEALQLSAEECEALFYALLLKDLGCSSNAAKISHLFGTDDRRFKHSVRLVDWTQPLKCVGHCWTQGWQSTGPLGKVKRIAELLTTKAREVRSIAQLRCDRGAAIARKLALPEATAVAIYHLDELWNGRGNPKGLKRHAIPLLARICGLAQTVEVHMSASGMQAAMEMALARRGRWFDPELVDILLSLRNDQEFWSGLADSNVTAHLEPYLPREDRLSMGDSALDCVAESFAMVVDAKSPWTHQHSSRVAEIAVGVSRQLGCSPQVQQDIRRAGLLHDIGKLGVSNAILDKPGKPTAEEMAEIRRHAEYTEQILAQVDAFARLADIAGAHHERLDGQGYHRARSGEAIPMQARILTVADVFEAMTARRPYRAALSCEQALQTMQREVGKAFDPDCLNALVRWAETAKLPSRVDDQWDRVESMFCELDR